ncbi:hypothetical protein KEM54_004988 [Ascosphaera aggregata]|nr:hypothetical protein KEM54_004988 [Ascosphaera aggregata]
MFLLADDSNAGKPAGAETWFILNQLRPGQRYEVRVCWAATQPTELWLHTFTIDEIRESPALNLSLVKFIASEEAKTQRRQLHRIDPIQPSDQKVQTGDASSLFLRVTAAADYFTLNETLMLHPEPIHVDLILDPFLGNVFPRSLVPVGMYISIIAVIAWFVSGLVWGFLLSIAETESAEKGKKNA